DFSADYFDCALTMDERLAVLALFQQRIGKRLPAAYITHEAWFAGLAFYVDERVLIPRSPIAELIQVQFEPWLDPASVHRVLDLCTGSGCIAIACAYAFEAAAIVASDYSADALAVAAKNREAHGLESRLQLIESDLFESVPPARFDLIVSNPPYVSLPEMQQLAAEFDHEPGLALAAGNDGMDLVIPMLQQARQYLSDQGVLVVEVGYSKPALEALLPQVPFYWLDFEYGGDGVFLLTAEQLDQCQPMFDQLLSQRKV
ncbi:MAG TPA: 50S ribosomal protein L3 N(5)-glutamine methyltransferase, partial [Thiotrichales bacterium]|nr:50S ribosomal protein L3 N(5)-glutamine methyltransferase [Thiotrichales bacterium]